MGKCTYGLLAIALVLLAMAGCTKSPTTSGDYIFEGQKLMEEQKYGEAAEKFAAAITEDPDNSTSRYLHAKAIALHNGVDILHCLKYVDMVQKINTTGSLFDFPQMNYTEVDNIYVVNGIIKADLKPIFDGQTIHGLYDKKDIMLDYFICNTTYTALSFLDIFPHDGHIDNFQDNKAMNVVKALVNGTNKLTVENLDSLKQEIKDNPQMLNDAIDAIVQNFDDSKDLVVALVQQTGGEDIKIDTTTINAAMDSIQQVIELYKYNPGTTDSTAIAHYDSLFFGGLL